MYFSMANDLLRSELVRGQVLHSFDCSQIAAEITSVRGHKCVLQRVGQLNQTLRIYVKLDEREQYGPVGQSKGQCQYKQK